MSSSKTRRKFKLNGKHLKQNSILYRPRLCCKPIEIPSRLQWLYLAELSWEQGPMRPSTILLTLPKIWLVVDIREGELLSRVPGLNVRLAWWIILPNLRKSELFRQPWTHTEWPPTTRPQGISTSFIHMTEPTINQPHSTKASLLYFSQIDTKVRVPLVWKPYWMNTYTAKSRPMIMKNSRKQRRR